MSKVSVIDEPIVSIRDDKNRILRRSSLGADNPDKLGTGKYAETLAEFIKSCETPITIGVQGEWGSGKTSLLNMIKEDLEENERTFNRKTILGKEEFRCIWINTWEHSLLKTPEECLISIIEEIIDEIARVDNSYQKASQAKAALMSLAKGAVRAGAHMALGHGAAAVADELMGSSSVNSVKQLRNSLIDIIDTVVDRKENDAQKFIIFIDDLDRLEPAIAVSILELLKNIFTIKSCVFVLAIDYQVIVKGLKGKFGNPTPENEWEFRAFFDKIIQLPFMMPMRGYDLKSYINALLIDKISFFQKSERVSIEDGKLARAVQLTLGHNPRAMKRLLNSLSLLKLQHAEELEDFRVRQLVFAVVCCQISFPNIYDLLVRNPDFSGWDTEFVNKVTGGPHEEDMELQKALFKASQVHEEDFDEEWEQALFQIVWLKNWQRSRLPEASRLLSEIKDRILSGLSSEDFEKIMRNVLQMTSVTAVSTTDEGILSGLSDQGEGRNADSRIAFWAQFGRYLSGSKTVFDSNNPLTVPIKSTHSSGTLVRKHEEIRPDSLVFVASTSSTSPLRLESFSGESSENYQFFALIRSKKSELENITGGQVKFRINESAAKQIISFEPPVDLVPRRLRLDDEKNLNYSVRVHEWIRDVLLGVEVFIKNISSVHSDEVSSDVIRHGNDIGFSV